MDLREDEDTDWIHLAQDRGWYRPLVNTADNHRALQKTVNLIDYLNDY
jgi:hypothetical protein